MRYKTPKDWNEFFTDHSIHDGFDVKCFNCGWKLRNHTIIEDFIVCDENSNRSFEPFLTVEADLE